MMFSFFKKKPAPKIDLYSLEYQYKELLKMSQDYPEICTTEETDDFELKFIDCGVRYDTYTNEEISMEKIIYTSKEPMVFSANDAPQIHYGVIEVEEGYRVWEVLTSSSQIPEQVKQHLISHGYGV